MKSRERIEALLKGETPDRIPIFPKISFATSCVVPGMNMHDYTTNPENMAKAIILSAEKYGYDAVGITTDIANESAALGSIYDRPENQPSKLKKYFLESIEDYERVKMVDPLEAEPTKTIIEATRIVKEEIGNQKYIMSWCNGPLNVASQLMPMEEVLIGMIEEPEMLHELLERCLNFSMRYVKLLINAGADAVSFGHAMASCTVISRNQYLEFALPYEKRLVDAIHKAGGKALTHICGNIVPILADIDTNGSDFVDFDHMCNPADVLKNTSKIIRGNIDPLLFVNGTPDKMSERIEKLISVCKDSKRFILGSGCEITAAAKEENIRMFVEAGNTFGEYN